MTQFPLFLMYVDKIGKFYPKHRAGALLDSWFSKVEPGNLVLNEDFTVRKITEKESCELVEISDKVSESK